MKKSKTYPNIDMDKTGLQLKKYIEHAGLCVKDIQDYLHLSCPQPIYRWMNGKILPSVDHLFMLSELFGVHMEELLVKKQISNTPEVIVNVDESIKNRIMIYYQKLSEMAA